MAGGAVRAAGRAAARVLAFGGGLLRAFASRARGAATRTARLLRGATAWQPGVRQVSRLAGALLLGIVLAWVQIGRAVADEATPEADRVWPVAGPLGGRQPPVVLRGFEPPAHPWSAGHRGVDLAAAAGAGVRAVASGRVVFAGTVAGRGVVSVELTGSGGPPPLRYTYEPVSPTVAPGDMVVAGQSVGTVTPGPFHCPGGCLHWGLLRGKDYLDPLSLLPPSARRLGPSRLLPVYGAGPPGAGADGAVEQDGPDREEPANAAGGVGHVAAASASAAAGTAALAGGTIVRRRGIRRPRVRRSARRGRRRAAPWRPRPG